MAIHLELLRGNEVKKQLDALAKLRIDVFREWPYLYDGSFENEINYLKMYAQAEGGACILAKDADEVIGASTCLPLAEATEDIQEPFLKALSDIPTIMYFGESALLKPFRGKGIGKQFMNMRERFTRKQGYFKEIVFCAVNRSDNHPLKPSDYFPLDAFWKSLGYQKTNFICRMSWKDVDKPLEDEKELIFWQKKLV